MNVLENIWFGNMEPSDQIGYREEELRNLIHLFERNEKKLQDTLNQSQNEDLQKMKDLMEEMQQITECGAFIAGFRLGVQIMAQSL